MQASRTNSSDFILLESTYKSNSPFSRGGLCYLLRVVAVMLRRVGLELGAWLEVYCIEELGL